MTEPPVNLKVQLFYSGAFQDITSYVYQRDPISITRGLANQGYTADAGSCTLTLNNRDGRFSNRNPNSPLYGLIGRNTQLRVLATPTTPDQFGLVLDALNSTSNATTPDNAALDITGDIDLAVEFRWLDAAFSTACLIEKGTVASGGSGTQFSYGLSLGSDVGGNPHLTLRWSTDGTTVQHDDIPISGLVTYAEHVALRVTLQVNDGGGHHVVRLYTSSDGTVNGSWTQQHVDTLSGTTSIFSGSGAVSMGTNGLIDWFAGTLFAAVVKNGIAGTVAASPSFTSQTAGTTSFTDGAGRVWTIGATASIDYQRYIRFTGEVISWPQQWDITGRDVYCQVQAAGILRRLGQGQAPASDGEKQLIGEFASTQYWIGDGTDPAGRVRLNNVGRVAVGGATLSNGTAVAGIPTTNTTYNANGFGPNSGYIGVFAARGQGTSQGAAFVFQSDALGPCAFFVQDYTFPGVNTVKVNIRADGTNNDIQVLLEQYSSGGTNPVYTTLGDALVAVALTDGGEHVIVIELDNDGSGNTDWTLYVDGVSAASGTVTGMVFQGIADMRLTYVPIAANSNADLNAGYLVAWSSAYGPVPDPVLLSESALGYTGETAGDRIGRLCDDNLISLDTAGDFSDTMLMGPQPSGQQLVPLMQEAATTDQGFLYEPVEAVGLAYATRVSFYNRDPQLALDYSMLGAPPNPVDDDYGLHNDVTATNSDGSSAEAVLQSGALSVQAPPDGVNTYSTSVNVNTATAGPLPDLASWIMHRSTVDEIRFPTIPINVLLISAVRGDLALAAQLVVLDITNKISLTNLPATLPPEDVDLVIYGLTESLTGFEWTITLNTLSDTPNQVAVYAASQGDTSGSQFDAEDSTVGTGFNTTATTLSIASAPNTALWTVDAAACPFDINIGGERMTVSAITGASSPQSFTVARSVNGIVKAHTAGEEVHIWNRARYAL